MLNTPKYYVAILVVALPLLNCTNDTSPTDNTSVDETAVGTYALTTVNGGTLPASIGVTQGSCPRYIDSGSLALKNDGGYELSLAIRGECPPGTGTVRQTVLQTGPWSTSSSTLTLTYGSGSELHPASTTLSDGTAQMNVQFEWAGEVPVTALVLKR